MHTSLASSSFAAPTCHTLDDAAKLALKLRPFSGAVVTLVGHKNDVTRVLPCRDGHIVTCSRDPAIKWWHNGECVRTIAAHADDIDGAAVLPTVEASHAMALEGDGPWSRRPLQK